MKVFCNMKKIILICVLLLNANLILAQYTHGRIVFERKTNLVKKFKDWGNDWLSKDEKDKIDQFEMYFLDSISVFKPVDSDIKERMSWATSKNTVIHNLQSNVRLSSKEIWNETLNMKDSIQKRKWIFTDDYRKIAGFKCRKVFTKVDDSTKIYAWYANEISVPLGPESYCGLPGMILGLATSDGGVVYFAKSISFDKPEAKLLDVKQIKGKIQSKSEIQTQLAKQFGDKKWGKNMIREYFVLW
jgi:GLPGLI family protein